MQKKTTSDRMIRKKEKRKIHIIETAMHLFDSIGFDETSMERIAEEADIAKGTLYNYFPVKEAIVAEEIRLTMQDQQEFFLRQLEKCHDTRERLSFVIRELMKKIKPRKEIFEKYLAYRMQKMISLHWDWEEDAKSGVYLLGYKIIELGKASGEVRTDLSKEYVEDFFEFIFISVIKQFYNNPDTFNEPEAIESAVDLFLNGVSNRT